MRENQRFLGFVVGICRLFKGKSKNLWLRSTAVGSGGGQRQREKRGEEG